jgi:outer membrane protein OmpA-like peptidoglycan-associated protein
MKSRFMMSILFFLLLLMVSGCAQKSSYFGIPNETLSVPEAFPETDKAIREAEQSPGSNYCPEKIEQAKALAREGVKAYWACRNQEGLGKLAEARSLAEKAKSCRPSPPPAPPPPSPPPPPQKPEVKVPLENVVIEKAFNFDSLKLNPSARALLDRQADMIKKAPHAMLEIYAHTDSVGTNSYNTALSVRRGFYAERYLESKGVPTYRMRAFGQGEHFPIAPNDTEEGRARNRRIEIMYVN